MGWFRLVLVRPGTHAVEVRTNDAISGRRLLVVSVSVCVCVCVCVETTLSNACSTCFGYGVVRSRCDVGKKQVHVHIGQHIDQDVFSEW